MTAGEFQRFLKETNLGHQIIEQLLSGTYQPNPLARMRIPKKNGDYREIFVPTVQDRAIQRMIVAALHPPTEARFYCHSYGFRPGRNVHQAVQQVNRLAQQGYQFRILLDFENFFGSIDRELRRKYIRDYVTDPILRELINAFITVPIQLENRMAKTNGVPAGIPLAPMLANMYLHPLDKDLSRQGIQFVRYADDLTLLFKSETERQSSYIKVVQRCEERFRVQVNHQKTVIDQGQRSVLGFLVGEYGGITHGTGVIDAIRESLVDLLAAPTLNDFVLGVRSRICSALAHLSIVGDFELLVTRIDCLLDEIRVMACERFGLLEILHKAGRIHRVKDYINHCPLSAMTDLIPPVRKLKLYAKLATREAA